MGISNFRIGMNGKFIQHLVDGPYDGLLLPWTCVLSIVDGGPSDPETILFYKIYTITFILQVYYIDLNSS